MAIAKQCVALIVISIYAVGGIVALFRWGPQKRLINWLSAFGTAIALLLLSLSQFTGGG